MAKRVIAGRYELLTVIGQGGLSKVYLARDKGLNKNWAVKEVPKEGIVLGAKIHHSLLTEANLLKNLDHPALPRIVDIIEEGECYYIVMDYVEGENLKSILETQGPQDQRTVISWILQVASVLSYLHNLDPPIIYRDMKPSNIILQPNGSLKLIDFGIARVYKEGKKEDTMALGTSSYAAPEQFTSEKKGSKGRSDVRSDIYSLGITMYELLTNHLPTKAPYHLVSVRKYRPEVSVGIEKIIKKATSPDPDDRFQHIEDFIYALLNYEKLDDEYVQEKKDYLKKAFIPVICGLALIVISVGLFIANGVIKSNSYNSLLMQTANSDIRKENLAEAITIKPEEEKAYMMLIEEYSKDGITENESGEMLSQINAGLSKLSEEDKVYLDVNYSIGEALLMYYSPRSDDSLRNRILTAAPFFAEVSENATEEDYEDARIASAYAGLSDFYERFVLAADNTIIPDANKAEYNEFFTYCEDLIDLLSEEKGNAGLKLTSYQLILGVIDSEKTSMANTIKKNVLIKTIDSVQNEAEGIIATSSPELAAQKNEVISSCESLRSGVDDAYTRQARESRAER